MSRRFFDRTADLVGQLNGNGQKVMLQIDTTGTVPTQPAVSVPWASYFQW